MRGCLNAYAQLPPPLAPDRPYVAVATLKGALVNLHLGEAASFQIWGPKEPQGFQLIEERPAPPSGGGAATGGGPWPRSCKIVGRCW